MTTNIPNFGFSDASSQSSFDSEVFFEQEDFLHSPAPSRPLSRPGPPRGSSACSNESVRPAQGANARYVAPHAREAKMETGDDVAMPKIEKKGDEEGVEGRHFGRLIIYCMIALTKATVVALNSRFPGCFFQSKDVTNHDHPIAHIVTQVGTRFLQRMIKNSAQVLDVYGNPAAANAFNRKQARRPDKAKNMQTICQRFGAPDFIREINKWGPMVEEDSDGVDSLRWDFRMVMECTAGFLSQFSIFQCIHTLYYLGDREIMHMLKSSPQSKILALIHSHPLAHGFINGGEQEYWVKDGVVKQKNVKTNSVYYHKDITPLFFSEKKEKYIMPGDNLGYTWECHFVCEDTWIVEIALCDRSAIVSVGTDWEAKFLAAERKEAGLVEATQLVPVDPPSLLPTRDGKWVELQCPNEELFGQLRMVASGKKRTGKDGQKLMLELVQTAKHLVNPGALFPEANKMSVDVSRIGDYVIKAFIADVPHETNLYAAVDLLEPVLLAHTKVRAGKVPNSVSVLGMLQLFRGAVGTVRIVNRVARSSDVVEAATKNLGDALDDSVWGL